jgi:hypothetical protein
MLGIDGRHVRRLNADGVFPRAGKGRHAAFDPFVCVPLFITYVRQGAEKTVGIAQSRQALVDSQRRALELKTRRTERELVPIEEVAQGFEAAMVAIGASLDGLGGRLCGELVGMTDVAVIRQRIFDETRRIRNTAADNLDALARVAPRSESTPGTAPKDAGRVGRRVPSAP